MTVSFESLKFLAGDLLNGRLPVAMEPKSGHGASYGDVVACSRGLYWHYAVYVSDAEVIHYTSEHDDVGTDLVVMTTDFAHFLRKRREYWVVDYGADGGPVLRGYRVPKDWQLRPMLAGRADAALGRVGSAQSADETVRRARQAIGAGKYLLASSNCEHFAVYCKTGEMRSHQVDRAAGLVREVTRYFAR